MSRVWVAACWAQYPRRPDFFLSFLKEALVLAAEKTAPRTCRRRSRSVAWCSAASLAHCSSAFCAAPTSSDACSTSGHSRGWLSSLSN